MRTVVIFNSFVEFVKKKYRINDNKVYMTGLSMGAISTFDYALKYPGQLAAIVPIAGRAKNIGAICNISNIPMWAFHGDADPTVEVYWSKEAVNKYNACSPKVKAKLTLYPGVGHNSWTRTYDGSAGHDIYNWMLQYTRGGSSVVRTANVAPNVNAGSDKAITLPDNSLSLSGSASDSDGSIASVSWTKLSGPYAAMSGANTLNLKLSNLQEGTYTFRLTAKDNAGASKYDDVLVKVNKKVVANAAPTVSAGSDKTITLPTSSLTLSGTASDSDGSIVSVSWTKVSGSTVTMSGTTSLNLSLSNLQEGTYTFRLTAKDNAGASKYDDVLVKVNKKVVTNNAPVVSAGSDQAITLPTNSLSLKGSASDSDGHVVSTTWNKVSGPHASMSNTSSLTLNLSNLQEGTYIFRLTAKDNAGASKYDDVQVKVNKKAATNAAPIVNAGSDKTITLPDNSLSLSGSASDADGSVTSVSWTKQSGPSVSMSGANTLNLKLSNLHEGTYTFRLTAKDNDGASKYDDVQVRVNKQAATKPAPAPEPVVAASSGLNYKLYNTNKKNGWRLLPNFSRLTPAKTGTVNNFSLSPKTQHDYYALEFDGYIQIDAAGVYSFYVNSDDGSQLFINGKMIVNNDGAHPAREKSGSVNLSVGRHAIKVTYFEYVGRETLKVRYAGPGIKKRTIPNNKLFTSAGDGIIARSSSNNEKSDLAAPTNLTVQKTQYYSKPALNWKDNSTKETGNEVFMSVGNNRNYKQVGSTGPNATSYTIGAEIKKGQVYYIKVRARNSKGRSGFSKEVVIGGTATTDQGVAAVEETNNLPEQTLVSVYPNPAAEFVNIQLGSEFSGSTNIQLLDLSGKVLHQETVAEDQERLLRLDLINKQLKNGIYIIRLEDGVHQKTVKLLVQ